MTVAVLTLEDLRQVLLEAGEIAARRVLEERGHDAEWLGRQEVAALLGYKQSYISELVRRHGLPCQRVGRKMRFRKKEVSAWVAARGRSG